MEYTYQSYAALIQHIQDCGRTVCPLRGVGALESYVILRHDVDYSIIKARRMAELECRIGVRSTYFVLLTSPYYNLLTSDHLKAARDIAAMGHEIGLHYEADGATDHDVECRKVIGLARFLGEIVGAEVTSIAQHNPSETTTRLRVPGLLDAYGDRFFREIAYLSDSRRLFGTPDVHHFFRTHSRSQLLIHPLWWHETEKSRWESFAAIRDQIATDVYSRLSRMNASMEADELKRALSASDPQADQREPSR